MPLTLQVAYPTDNDTKFDHDYYSTTHMALVAEHMGPHLTGASASKGLGGPGPGTPTPFHAIATLTFADQAAMDAAMAAAGPVIADIPNFTDSPPHMMVGEVIG